ncbi:hypothetical protein AB1Y20_007925 [Prymnesium parvum]|uniref:Sfi1 spindle body domain-containing protein n=1 Tax=Prymnesium parvum TaxID=97485 RepID=A0AB34IVM9_PRYPA
MAAWRLRVAPLPLSRGECARVEEEGPSKTLQALRAAAEGLYEDGRRVDTQRKPAGASPLSIALTSESISSDYLQEFCEGIPKWEVEFFIVPGGVQGAAERAQRPTSPGRERTHHSLMERAREALRDGEPRRAYLLGEQAHAALQTLDTLLFLTRLRRDEMHEPQFAAAALHSMLRMLHLSPAEREEVEQMLTEAEAIVLRRRSREQSRDTDWRIEEFPLVERAELDTDPLHDGDSGVGDDEDGWSSAAPWKRQRSALLPGEGRWRVEPAGRNLKRPFDSKWGAGGARKSLAGATKLLVAAQAEEYAPRTHLERFLSALPGLQPERSRHVRGLRPLERCEVVASVLRCECTPWEAAKSYTDSQMEYHRQRFALLLQDAYRQWRARQVARLRRRATLAASSRYLERDMLARAVGFWRYRWVFLVFKVWQSLMGEFRRAKQRIAGAILRLRNITASRALNAWRDRAAERRAAILSLQSAAVKWLSADVGRAFRAWVTNFHAHNRAFMVLRRAAVALLERDLRTAMNSWQEAATKRRGAVNRFSATINNWQQLSLAASWRRWRDRTATPSRRLLPPRQDRLIPPAHWQPRHFLIWKRGRYTGIWRKVRLELHEHELVYTYGSVGDDFDPRLKRRAVPLSGTLGNFRAFG